MILFVAVFVILLTSCSGIDTPDIPAQYPIHLSANSPSPTKISVNGTSLSWESSDILQITAVTADNIRAVADLSVYHIDVEDPHQASFTGFVTLKSAPVDCYFTYPSGDAMSVTSDGKILVRYNNQDGSHNPFLYSKESYNEDGINSALKFAGAMLAIDVQVEGVCSLVFFGNKFEDMFPLVIDPINGSYSKSDEMGYQIQVPVQGEGLTYICVPPVKLDEGFSIVLVDESGHQMIRSFSDGTTGGYDFTGKEGYIIPITISGGFSEFGVSYSDLSYGHTYKDNLLSGTAVSFKMEKSGTPNTRIQEWGATLVDSQGKIVRSFKSNDGSALSGDIVTLNTVGNYKLLTAGEYIFSPYYRIYDQTVTLGSETITIPDPGVKITLGGYTSYDKYTAGDISGANSCVNTTIYGVTASINVHSDIIDSYKATLGGEEIAPSSASGSEVSFGSLTRTTFKAYPYKVTVNVGNLTFEAGRDFHITGLPMMGVSFMGTMPNNWGRLGEAESPNKNDGIVFPYGTLLGGSKKSGILSPKFYVPAKINVKTSADVSCEDGARYLFVKSSPASNYEFGEGDSKIDPYNDNKTSNRYYECDKVLELTSGNTNLLYCTIMPYNINNLYKRLFVYRVNIYYNNTN